jgi:chemotaxis protein methyltransferase CheR
MRRALPLSPQVFSILSGLIEEQLGLHFGPDQLGLLADKLSPRVLDRGFESMLDYYYFLRYDPEGPAELGALADALTVNETYFFREATQVAALIEEQVASLISAGRRPRIWCAACATGEEPLSLAAMLDERGWLAQVDIVASDLSPRVLAAAQRGLYSGRALRAFAHPPAWLQPEGEAYRVSKRLRDAIEWRQVNLVDSAAVRKLGRFDAIICRNVMIYFRDETTKLLAARLHDALVDDGLLLVGVSESLLRVGTSFVCEERRGAFFYRKAAS